jgi:hypothetical protein
MPAEKSDFGIPFPRLLVALLVTIIPISVGGLYSISHSDKALERNIGLHFQTIAEGSAAQVAAFVHDRLANVGFLAVEPVVVDQIGAANAAYSGLAESVVASRFQSIEKTWDTPASKPVVDHILASRASSLLRRFREHDPRFLRITVTDVRGGVVAATHKTEDYYQADEEFWQAIFAAGRGAVNITDVKYDPITKSYYIGIGVPVPGENGSGFIGAVDALVDVSTLFPVVNRAQLGPSARSLIVKEDGTIIAGPNVNLAMGLKAEEYLALDERLGGILGRRGGYLVSDLRGANRSLIGYADTGLKSDYGNLGWAVLVAQDTVDALGPVRVAGRLLAFMSLIGLAAVTLLTVYFVLHRRRTLTEIESIAHRYA